ncbi:MAG: sulfite oxidase [Chloroflexota bacterium]|nr:sulfite oxidase [Chloroflexota bacterium]
MYTKASDPTDGPLTLEELQLATRNRGMPLEAMRYDITPVGMHYLLTHFDVPFVDADSWRLQVGGAVARPFELSLDDISAMPAQTLAVTMECAGNGRARLRPRPLSNPWLYEAIGNAEWTGTSLWPLLDRAGLNDDAVELLFTGADRGLQKEVEHNYQRSLTVEEVKRPEVMLVYAMNGRPLEPQNGFPLRLLVPGWYGMTSVKWLQGIEAVTQPFTGYQQHNTYRFKQSADELGEPVQRIRPRALMVPPGVPDYFSRHRMVDAGRVELIQGRAWSGQGEITKVEVGVDGSWSEATLGDSVGPFAWRSWSFAWEAKPGEHTLSCRATDSTGAAQPIDQPWNYQGMGNNSVQTVAVTVR